MENCDQHSGCGQGRDSAQKKGIESCVIDPGGVRHFKLFDRAGGGGGVRAFQREGPLSRWQVGRKNWGLVLKLYFLSKDSVLTYVIDLFGAALWGGLMEMMGKLGTGHFFVCLVQRNLAF